jgi:hypothetical protein
MKNLIVTALLLSVGQITTAQIKVTDFTESELKGHVKTAVEYTFRGDINLDNVDTSAYSGKTTRTFDKNGHQLYELIVWQKGQAADSLSYQYSGDSLVVKNQYLNGKPAVKYTYKYDNDGKETEFDTFSDYDPRIVMDAKIFYKYNEAGDISTEETFITGHKLTMRVTYQYNAQHQKIKEEQTTYFNSQKTIENSLLTYDLKVNKVTEKIYDATGKLIGGHNILYADFDKEGNWLSKVFELKGSNQRQGNYSYQTITKRVIEYY